MSLATPTELDIISVNFRSWSFLERNVQALAAANPQLRLHWHIADNELGVAPAAFAQLLVSIHPGVARPEAPHGAASYHHGAALNSLLEQLRRRSRYLLVLDPDCFAPAANLLAQLLHTMAQQQLAVLGVPWHPRWYSKYRGFPCAHFMLLDLEQLPAEALDFRPDQAQAPVASPDELPWASSTARARRWLQRCAWLDTLCRKFGLPAPLRAVARSAIGASRDTGYRIYAHVLTRPALKWQVLMPFQHAGPLPSGDQGFVRSWLNRLIERWLPAPLRFNAPDATQLRATPWVTRAHHVGFECFGWNGQPAVMHVRGFPKQHQSQDAQLLAVDQLLAEFPN